MTPANFFWHGPALGLYERACLLSFVRSGAEARLYTFNPDLNAPAGVRLMDARAFGREEEVLSYSYNGVKGAIAAFADVFRYRLLQAEPGWWFDVDVFCLQGSNHFSDLEKTSTGLLVGEQSRGSLNNAVMFVSDRQVAVELERRANAKGKDMTWGDIGPTLIDEFHADHPDRVTVASKQVFYPVHYDDVGLFFDPHLKQRCFDQTGDAVCTHLWNEIIGRWRVPKDILPCRGSYLHDLFTAVGIEVSPQASLSTNTFNALRAASEIGVLGRSAIGLERRARQLKRTVRELRWPA